MKITIILNPYANRWGAGNRAPDIEQACRKSGLECDLQITRKPEEGIDLAYAAARDETIDAVVAAGGDGTINEVVNGLLRASGDDPTRPLGIVPLGTANDFARMAGIPLSLEESLQVIVDGTIRPVDGGRINSRFFINNSAVAMEPMVTIESRKISRLSGEMRYMVALMRALARLKPWHMQITWDGGDYDGPVFLMSVCNSPRTGGFTMAPGAEIDDGLFDVVFFPEVPKSTVITVLGRLLRGTHINHPAVTYGRTKRLRFISQPGTPIHADGEVFDESLTQGEYEILPGRVSLLSPAPTTRAAG